MAVNKMEDLLKWMAIKPRSFGWGAIGVYDRLKTNTLIRQEFIKKFSAGHYLPPASGPVTTGDATWGYFYDQILDAPQISFENPDNDMEGQVHVTQSLMGGSRIELDNIGGKRLIKVASIDALDGPKLKMNARLREVEGTIDGTLGTVELDLGSDENRQPFWELTYADSQHERRKGGDFFKEVYKDAEKEKRIFTLGKVMIDRTNLLKPKSFRLLTQPAPDATSRASANYGNGAVALFFHFESDEFAGTLPNKDSDFKYLIPDDVPGEYDAALLLNNKVVMQNVLAEGVKRIFQVDHEMLEAEGTTGFVTTLRSNGKFAHIKFSPGTYYGNGFYINLYHYDLTTDQNLFLRLKPDGVVEMDWKRNGAVYYENRSSAYYSNNDFAEFLEIKLSLAVSAVGKFKLDSSTGTVKLDSLVATIRESSIPPWSARTGMINDERDKINAHILSALQLYIDEAFKRYFNVVSEINLFVLNSVLFESDNAVKLNTLHSPGDLIVFGKISPSQTSFTVNPMQPLMGHGKTQSFTTDSDRTDLVWTVENIPGETGNVGSITLDGKGGCTYTAPRDAELGGTFKRVKLTAKAPGTDFTSSALVTVLAHDISISPWIQICNHGEKRKLSAGTLGAGILDWSVKVPGYGTVTSSPDEEGKVTYTAGPSDETRTLYLEEIVVTNRSTKSSKSSYVLVLTQAITSVTVSVESESSYPQGKAQLLGKVGTGAANKNFEWSLLAGSGSIDATGLFTAGTAGEYPFALIGARREIPDFGIFEGFIILTVPLISLPDKPAL